jgi:hypothetical protein
MRGSFGLYPLLMLKLNRKNASLIQNAVEQWKVSGVLTDVEASKLTQTIEVVPFDWKRLAKYSFWIAIICLVTAVSAILSDSALMKLLRAIFDAPAGLRALGLAVIAGGFYYWGVTRKQKHIDKIYSNEALLFLGVLATAGSVWQIGEALGSGSDHFSVLLLLACAVYGIVGWIFKSNLIWLFSLVSLGGWFGAETGYVSGWGAYYFGMNYPLRFILFGGLLVAGTLVLQSKPKFEPFYRTTLIMGLLYLFMALWILSIFGNYGSMASWQEAKQIELFHWSLLFAMVAGGSVYHGLKTDNGVTKGFGITFLLINLYTRFFEFFWDGLHKAIFFALLAASFWWLGSRAEKIFIQRK